MPRWRRAASNSSSPSEAPRLLLENREWEVGGDNPVGLVHDLADAEIHGGAAEAVRLFSGESVLEDQMVEHVPNCRLGVREEVCPMRGGHEVAGLVCSRELPTRRCQELKLRGASVLVKLKAKRDGHRRLDPRSANLAITLGGMTIAARKETPLNEDGEKYKKMIDWIAKDIGVTTLRYQRLGDMIEAIGIPKEKLCTYCWTGKED